MIIKIEAQTFTKNKFLEFNPKTLTYIKWGLGTGSRSSDYISPVTLRLILNNRFNLLDTEDIVVIDHTAYISVIDNTIWISANRKASRMKQGHIIDTYCVYSVIHNKTCIGYMLLVANPQLYNNTSIIFVGNAFLSSAV